MTKIEQATATYVLGRQLADAFVLLCLKLLLELLNDRVDTDLVKNVDIDFLMAGEREGEGGRGRER